MARTLITPQSATSSGVAETYEPANAAGNSFQLASGRLLRIKNGGGTTCNVTIETSMTVDGLAVAERTIAVAAGTNVSIALGTKSVYRQTGGVAFIDYDQVTSVTVAVLSVP